MKKLLIIFLLLLPIVLPNYALAAWWNPFTWHIFNNWSKSNKPTASITSTIPQNTGDSSSEIEKLKKENEQLKKKLTSENPISKKQKSTNVLDNQSQYQKQTTPTTPPQIIPPPIETWAELEAKDFVSADQKGWTAQTITNALGEKRYYRKENGQWVRKNSEAEIQQPYVPPAPPPTSDQLARLERMCNLSVGSRSLCDKPTFMSSYNSNITFRNSIDEYVSQFLSLPSSYFSPPQGQAGYAPLPPEIQGLAPSPSQIQQFRGFQPPYIPTSPPPSFVLPPLNLPSPVQPYQPPLDTRCEYDPFTHVTNCTTGPHIGL